MLEFVKIHEVVTQKARELAARDAALGSQVGALVYNFQMRLGATVVREVSDIFELCDKVDSALRISPEVEAQIADTRREIRGALIEAFYAEERKAVAFGDNARMFEISILERLTPLIGRVVDLYKGEDKVDKFDPAWIRNKDEDLYDTVSSLITDPETGVQKWQIIKELFPKNLADKFDVTVALSREAQLLEKIEPYKDLARRLGAEVVAEFLVHSGLIREEQFSKTVGIMADYLGPVRIPTPTFDDMPGVDAEILRLPSIRRWMFIRLRNHVYQELVGKSEDTGIAAIHLSNLRGIEDRINEILGTVTDSRYPEHRQLAEEVLVYFREVLSIEIPARMRKQIQNKDGDVALWPSLRQRIAMVEMRGTGAALTAMEDEGRDSSRNRRKLIEFFMGKGKTAAAYLAKELVGASKMLYICPPGKLVDEMKERVKKYYKEGQEPTVGAIRAGMNDDELNRALSCEVVIFPYTVFGCSVGEKRIVDEVKKRHFDFMTVDEIHYAKKDDGRNTEVVYELATGIPGLYDKGHIAMLTGNSTPNRPSDIVAQLRLWDKDTFGDFSSLKATVAQVGPVRLRNAISDMVLLLDPPEDWEKYVKEERFNLYDGERQIYDALRNDDYMDHQAKLRALYLCAMNPSLFAPSGDDTHSAFFENLTSKLDEYLETHDAVVIAENQFRDGLLRECEGLPGEALAEKIRKHVGSNVDVYLIDGLTVAADRETAFEASKRKGGRKTVIIAMGDIIRVGIDLSHISRCIALNPCWNKPDFAQLVKRFAREGNENVEVSMLVPEGTVLEGVLEHATEKEFENMIFKYGGALTEDDLAILERGDMADEVVVSRGRVYLGTIIRSHTLSDKQKLSRIYAYMANLKEEDMRVFMAAHGAEFARLFVKVWDKGYGGNNGRLVAGLWKHLEENGIISGTQFADLGCGHLALENTLTAMGGNRTRIFYNLDINGHMLEAGRELLHQKKAGVKPNMQVGSFVDMHEHYSDGQFDAVNASLSLYCTHLGRYTTNLERSERVKTLLEYNRILRYGGVLIITLPKNSCTYMEAVNLMKALCDYFGFEVLFDYSGKGESTDDEDGNKFENFVIVCKKVREPNLNGKAGKEPLKLSQLEFTRQTHVPEPGVRKVGPTKKPDEQAGCIHTKFEIAERVHFECDYGVDAEKAALDRFLAEVHGAREVLLGIYRKHGNTLKNLDADDFEKLKAGGISPIDCGGGMIGFILASDPNKPKMLYYLNDMPHEGEPEE